MKEMKAIITGGSKGIGKAIALLFAENGMDICITGRHEGDLLEVKEEIEKLGRKCDIILADFNNMDEVREAGRKQGKVINISSLGAFVGSKGLAAYGASKAALRN